MLRARLIILAAAGLAATAAPASAADTIGPNGPLSFSKQVASNQVSWSMTGVPDIDQARGTSADGTKVGLPNGGYMYCVPTTGMDFLAYLADRGFGGTLGVPSKDWTAATNFNEMSVLLAQLGGEMGTDPANGTGGSGFVAAMTKRLAGSELGVAQTYYSVGDQGAPTVADVIQSGADGDLLAAGIGFYADETKGTKTLKRRVGGHAFAIVGGSGAPGAKAGTLSTRDPATIYTADTVQGPYTTDSHAIAPLTATFVYADANGVDQTYKATVGTWDGSKTTLFEGFTRIVPKTAWAGVGGKIVRIQPVQLVPDPGPLKTTYEVPGDGSVRALALSAATDAPAFLVKGSSNVYTLNPLSGKSTKLARVTGARVLTYGGPAQRLYVGGSKKLVAFDAHGHVVASHKLAAPLQALQFDASSGRLAAVAKGRLQLFSSGLHSLAARTLPAVQRKGSGAPLLAFTPGGTLLVGKTGQGTILQSRPNAVAARRGGKPVPVKIGLTSHKLQGGAKLHGMAVDDLGRVMVAVNGRLRVFSPGGRRRKGSPFDGARADNLLAVTRSFDNTAGAPFLATLDRTVGPPPTPPPPPPVVPARPDLVIGTLTNSTALVVRNRGTAAAGPFSVTASDPAGAPTTLRFAGLAAGAEAGIPRLTCAPGRTFVVDSGHEVVESDETNNTHACG